MSDLEKLLERLTIKRDNEEKTTYAQELDKTKFTIFKTISSLGYFLWDPTNSDYTLLRDIKNTKQILCHLDFDGKPNTLKLVKDIITPKRFEYVQDRTAENKFPYGQLDIACLHVAVKRGANLQSSVDFAFGGSTLEMLASKDSSEPYIAKRVPGTQCILVVKRKEYLLNLADIGFQFERYVTGNPMSDTSSFARVEYMHLAQVGQYKVLFRAEVDAVDLEGNNVEIKASNPRYFGTKVMFQMISSGSASLCHGEKHAGTLARVTMKSLSKVAKDALVFPKTINRLERNILFGMESLKDQIKDNSDYMISFENGSLKAVKQNNQVILPNDDILHELIS